MGTSLELHIIKLQSINMILTRITYNTHFKTKTSEDMGVDTGTNLILHCNYAQHVMGITVLKHKVEMQNRGCYANDYGPSRMASKPRGE